MNKQKQGNEKKTFRFKRFARKLYSAFNSLHKTVTIGVLSGCTLMSAHAASVMPAEGIRIETSKDSIPEKELEEVVVTASKADLPLSQASKLVTVISRKDIERSPVKSVQELLTYAAGIDVLQRGPHGMQADISLRGGSFDQTAILLNGINLTNPQTGHYSLDIPVNLSDIERIEIVQGSSSFLYGASAFSGGINIVTKKDPRSNAFGQIESGMHGLFGAEARGAYKIASSLHRLSAGYKRADGYIAQSDYKILNTLWQSRFDIRKSNLDVQLGYNQKTYGANTFYSPRFPNQFDKTQSIFSSIKGETHGRFKVVPHLYWNRHLDEFQLFRGEPQKAKYNYHRSDVIGSNLKLQYASYFGITSIGGEFRRESIVSSVLGKPMDTPKGNYTKSDDRDNISGFVEHTALWDRVTLSIGGLLNQNSAIDDDLAFYPTVSAAYRTTSGIKLFVSWSKATRMPTFTDLYYNTPTHSGNVNLLPEKNESMEAGMKYVNRLVHAYLTGFYKKGKNLIDWTQADANAKWQSSNIGKLNTLGVETAAMVFLDELFGKNQPFQSLQITYTHLCQDNDSEKEINNPISMYVRNYLRDKLTVNLQHTIVKDLSLGWNFRWQDRAGEYLQYENTKEVGKIAYAPLWVLDLKINYAIKRGNVFVNVNNIFDKAYVDLGNIPQPGFWLSGGVSYAIW